MSIQFVNEKWTRIQIILTKQYLESPLVILPLNLSKSSYLILWHGNTWQAEGILDQNDLMSCKTITMILTLFKEYFTFFRLFHNFLILRKCQCSAMWQFCIISADFDAKFYPACLEFQCQRFFSLLSSMHISNYHLSHRGQIG